MATGHTQCQCFTEINNCDGNAHMSAKGAYSCRADLVMCAATVLSLLSFINNVLAEQEVSPKRSKEEQEIIKAVREERLAEFPKDKKPVISASFLKELSNRSLPGLSNVTQICVTNVQIKEDVDFTSGDIEPYFSFKGCVFHGKVDLSNCRFKRGLNLSNCDFQDSATFNGIVVDGSLRCKWSHFHRSDKTPDDDYYVDFTSIRVTGMLDLEEAEFDDMMTMFNARVDGRVDCTGTHFHEWIRIPQAKIGGTLYIRKAHFDRGLRLDVTRIDGGLSGYYVEIVNGIECENARIEGYVDFSSARFTSCEDKPSYRKNTFRSTVIGSDLDFENASFPEDSTLDFSGLKIGGALNVTQTTWPGSEGQNRILISGMSYQNVIPTTLQSFQHLLGRSQFDADAYNSVEKFLRTYGRYDDANEIGKERAFRECAEKSFFPKMGSFILWAFVGNGYSPERAIVWSLVIVFAGAYLFRFNSMVCTAEKATNGGNPTAVVTPYVSFLYSLDLFIPAVDLGVAKHWVPRREHTGLLCWMYAQKILGWLLVPIGLLVFTGIIKV